MNKNTWVLVALAAFLGGVYAYYFTDWINTPAIQIIKADRPFRSPRSNAGVFPVSFTLDGKYELTDVSVYVASVYGTNRQATPLWHLVSPKGSEPSKGFIYGRPIPGMRPANTNVPPMKLVTGLKYRLIVKAGRARGEKEFEALEAQ
jgi:hypothetical protein